MEVHLDAEAQPVGQRKRQEQRRRPTGRVASPPSVVAEQTGRLLADHEQEWLNRLTTDPASFAAVEREVHEHARQQADLYVAGLLAKASQQPETAPHIDTVIGAAEVPLRPVEKKVAPWWSASWVAWRSQ